jgi:hypothetical protein
MTPQNKAWELVQKYIKYQHYLENDAWNQSKECALIAVDEIMLNEKINHSSLDKTYEYWEDVKKEIEAL